jgi:hypothetical protein
VSPVAVNVSTPLNDASVSSPVTIQAAASSGNTITGWVVYIDSINAFQVNSGSPLNVNLPMGFGWHDVLVRAWDSSGAYGDQTINLTVP